jgi:hypothetical protein
MRVSVLLLQLRVLLLQCCAFYVLCFTAAAADADAGRPDAAVRPNAALEQGTAAGLFTGGAL